MPSHYGKKMNNKKESKNKTKKVSKRTSLKGLKVGSKEYMQALRNRKK